MPVLGNLFGTPGAGRPGHGRRGRFSELREIGKLLAFLKEPEPPKGLKDAWSKLPIFKKVINDGAQGPASDGPCHDEVIEEGDGGRS